VIYLRATGVIGFGLGESLSTWIIRKRVQMLRLHTSRESRSDDSAVAYIIKKMDNELRTYSVRTGFAVILYIVFCLPWLLPYHTYVLGIVTGLMLLVPQSTAFVTEAEKKARGLSTVQTSKEPSQKSTSKQGSDKKEGGEQGRPSSPSATSRLKRDSHSAQRTPEAKAHAASKTEPVAPESNVSLALEDGAPDNQLGPESANIELSPPVAPEPSVAEFPSDVQNSDQLGPESGNLEV